MRAIFKLDYPVDCHPASLHLSEMRRVAKETLGVLLLTENVGFFFTTDGN